ncbi:prepilin-type N-terminal cleavage/methylation domain-containing protein [Bacillus sp. BGMRC 2118]|nr:prepilin-type N-terminal cleavage/methylation domain-containing protein [Bacillus sp. BGMRC 2118]
MLRNVRKMFKDQKGLTLIELLAVVVILGIIAAIAVPAIGNIIDNTREDAVIAEGIQIINGAKIAYASQVGTAADGTTTITAAQLADFVDNVSEDTEYTVTVTNGVFTLVDHISADFVTNAQNNTTVTEQELIAGQ